MALTLCHQKSMKTRPDIFNGHRAAVYGISAEHEQGCIITSDGAGMLVRWLPGQPDGALIAQGQSPWYACACAPHAPEVAAGNQAGQIWWVNQQSIKVTGQVTAHAKGVFGLKYIQGSLVSLGGDGVLHRWEGTQKTSSIKLSHANLRNIAVHPELNLWAVAASDANIYLLDSINMRVSKVIVQAHVPSVFAVCFSACGKFLISGGRDAHLCIWAIEHGFELMHRIPAHNYTINDLLVSPDGKKLISASRDRTIKIWDPETFQLLKVLNAARYSVHTASVNRLAWFGEQLWSVSDDKRVVAWSDALLRV